MIRATLCCALTAMLSLEAGFVLAADGFSETPLIARPPTVQAVSATAGKLTPQPLLSPTEDEARLQFEQAREEFKAMAAGSEVLDGTEEYQVAVFSDPSREFIPGSDDVKNVDLGDIRVLVDVEDTSLREVVNEIVGQAAEHTGAWTVKWRLNPENKEIPNQQVNLTAESDFNSFMARLTQRVHNETGVNLFVTAFQSSRVILITDSFY